MSKLVDRPIHGEKQSGLNRPTQAPESELVEAFDKVFSIPEIKSIEWTQYTPYFNDGDVCEFSAHEISVRFMSDVKLSEEALRYVSDYEDEPDEDEREHGNFGEHIELHSLMERQDEYYADENRHLSWEKRRELWSEEIFLNGESRPDVTTALRQLSTAIESGEHENVLVETFGDHARIVADRDGFHIEFYNHN